MSRTRAVLLGAGLVVLALLAWLLSPGAHRSRAEDDT